jgi:endoglucanase
LWAISGAIEGFGFRVKKPQLKNNFVKSPSDGAKSPKCTLGSTDEPKRAKILTVPSRSPRHKKRGGFMLKFQFLRYIFCAPLLLTTSFARGSNYAEALQKSQYFYEAQRSGKLPENNRVMWRGNSGLSDGASEGVDLVGGWYDAGDHVKFGFPAAGTATLLAWSLIENENAYRQSGQYQVAVNNLKWINDYFIKAHSAPDTLWGQVGEGGIDHGYWGPPEVMPMARKAFKIDATCPGSDLAGETAAAMAAASVALKNEDPDYSLKLLQHSKELYKFAYDYRGTYSDCIKDAAGFYRSNGYNDELVWGGLWLYRATMDKTYLDRSQMLFDNLKSEGQHPYKWTHGWDDKTYGSYILMYQLTGKDTYKMIADRWLDYWTVGIPEGRVRYTPGGLAWLDLWGALRYTSNTAMLSLIHAKSIENVDMERSLRYKNFGKNQIDYMLGNNPQGISYVIGYGDRFAVNAHHRGAHGSWSNNINVPKDNRHILYGALVGGPDLEDRYSDDRNDYVKNEVAIDYNAGFQGAVAALLEIHGGQPDPTFPQPEVRGEEFFSTARINAEGENFFEIALKLHNRSAWPARTSSQLVARYYFSLEELLSPRECLGRIKVTTNYNQGVAVSEVKARDTEGGVYFVEADFSNADLKPTGEGDSQKEVQFRITTPGDCGKIQVSNDWSYVDLVSFEFRKTPKIPVFDRGQNVWGSVP